ncbi:MAG: hypothetical protein IKY44_05095 [Clostridia bacterium]|nr:hypothetical protein [Clostridia bacterium]
MKKVLAILFVLVMAASVMVGCTEDTTTTTTTTTAAATTTTTTAATTTTQAKETYEEILANAGVVHLPTVKGEKTASFVSVDEDVIDVIDYGYNSDGVICEMIETTYMPFGGTYTDEYAETLDEVVKAEFTHFDSIDCATVESRYDERVYVLVIKYTDLDNLDNIRALYEADIFNEAYSYYLMADAEAEMLSTGYVKK